MLLELHNHESVARVALDSLILVNLIWIYVYQFPSSDDAACPYLARQSALGYLRVTLFQLSVLAGQLLVFHF